MCYHISQRKKEPDTIEQAFQAAINFDEVLLPVYNHLNGFNHDYVMIIIQEHPDLIQLAKWGIVPPNYQGDMVDYWKKYSGGALNTRDDKFFINNTWKDDAIEENKCLIIVDGLYEPHHVSGHRPIPHYFERYDSSLFALWGIYTKHGDLNTCSVLTTRANPLFTEIHNKAKRMPFCLHPESKDYFLGLDNEKDIINEFLDFRAIELIVRPVSRDVMNSNIKSDREGIMDKIEYTELQKPDTLF